MCVSFCMCSKYVTLKQCRYNVVPASETLVQHSTGFESTCGGVFVGTSRELIINIGSAPETGIPCKTRCRGALLTLGPHLRRPIGGNAHLDQSQTPPRSIGEHGSRAGKPASWSAEHHQHEALTQCRLIVVSPCTPMVQHWCCVFPNNIRNLRNVGLMLISVYDAGPASIQHCVDVPRLLGSLLRSQLH